jgi:hypothetical protein
LVWLEELEKLPECSEDPEPLLTELELAEEWDDDWDEAKDELASELCPNLYSGEKKTLIIRAAV